MLDLAMTPPVLILMIGAAGWTFWRAVRCPQSIAASTRGRAGLALVEGSICALVWAMIELWVVQSLGTEALWDGMITGLTWAASSWWSANRFSAALHRRTDGPTHHPSHSIRNENGPHSRTNGSGSPHDVRHAAPVFQMEDIFHHPPVRPGTNPLHAPSITWPVRAGYLMAALLSGAGLLVFWALLFEVSSPWWSRPALLLQLAAFVVIAILLVTQTRPLCALCCIRSCSQPWSTCGTPQSPRRATPASASAAHFARPVHRRHVFRDATSCSTANHRNQWWSPHARCRCSARRHHRTNPPATPLACWSLTR